MDNKSLFTVILILFMGACAIAGINAYHQADTMLGDFDTSTNLDNQVVTR